MRNSSRLSLTTIIIIIVISLSSSFGIYFLHKNQRKLFFENKQLLESIENISAKQKSLTTKVNEELMNAEQAKNTAHSWLNIQREVADTVIQIFANVAAFNLLEPYKTPEQGEGCGTGFFINNEGHFITNYHVIAQASNVSIQIPSCGMERFDAIIIGVSPERDIALLKLSPEALIAIKQKINTIPFLKLGDSDLVLRSQEILALGYPLGQSKLKSTMGIVSGRERLGYFGYIQITAPLNPGNSGGPAINTSGEVIGINSRGIMDAQNIGYIIPINEVKSALTDLYTVPLLRKPTLGCIFTMATPEMVNYLGNPTEGGWYIAKVFNNTLLKSIGIQDEDMLYEINGHKIDMYGELNVAWSEDKVSIFELLNRFKVGDTLNFVIYRKGTRKEFSFKLEHKFLPPIRTIYTEFEKEFTDYEIIGGMVIMQLTMNHVASFLPRIPDMIKYVRVDGQQEPALIITHVLPNSQAAKARVIHAGEIIETINDVSVKTLADFREAVKKSKKTKYLTIKTDDDMYAVLSTEKIIAEDKKLANLYFYKPSSLLQDSD